MEGTDPCVIHTVASVPIEGTSAVITEKPSSPVKTPSNSAPGSTVSNAVEVNARGADHAVTELPILWIPKFNHIPGFPHFVLPRKLSYADQTYARSLFASGHGYALFTPETVAQTPDDFRQKRGISIGDVGILNRNNEFFFVFNIFLPADHPYNKDNTPDSFYPIEPLKDSEVYTSVDHFPPSSVIASKGVNVTRHSGDPLHLTFRSSEPQGSVLILPEGATRQNISINTTRVHDYVALNAIKWASFFANEPHYSAANGATYVVTGVDKTSVCSMLTFPCRPLASKMAASYENGRLYALEGVSIARNEGKPEMSTSTPCFNNLCIFMRGIRISLGRTEWLENVNTRPEYATPYTEVFTAKPRRPLVKPKSCFRRNNYESLTQEPPFTVHPFHPSDVIAQIMFSMDPNAAIVLVDDSIWSIFYDEISETTPTVPLDPLTFSCLRRASFDDFGLMFDEIFGLFDVIERQGCLRLIRNTKKTVTKDSLSTKFWLWVHGLKRPRASNAFKELLSQGQFHLETNHWVMPKD